MLVGHIKAVYEEIKYNCHQCDFTAQKRLSIRNKEHILEETKCDKCEHKRPAKKNLLRHKLYKHEGINDDLASLSVIIVVCPLILHGI